jgi:hypothetical protein
MALHADFLGVPKNSFLESQGHIRAQVLTALGACTPAASTAGAKEIAKAENVAQISEEIAEVLEHAGIKTVPSAAGSGANSGVTEAIVQGTLFLIGQNGIGLATFFETFFRFRIARVAVRMELQRQPPVGGLEFLIASRFGDAKDFVVIAFGIGRQGFYASRSSF